MNEITIIESIKPAKVCKTYSINAAGKIEKNATANVVEGTAITESVNTAQEMAILLDYVTAKHNLVLCAGTWRGAPADEFKLIAEADLAKRLGKSIGDEQLAGIHEINGEFVAARLKRSIEPSNWILLDADNPPGIPAEWAAMSIAERLSLWEPLLPGITQCERIELRGSSARVVNGSGSHKATHAWIRVNEPSKIALMKAHLGIEMVNKGLSFPFKKQSRLEPGRVVGIESRSVFDLAVFDTGRLVFCAKPEVLIEGYRADSAGVAIINEGKGELDIGWIKQPGPAALNQYKEKTGIQLDLQVRNGFLSVRSNGQLTMDSEITSKGATKPLSDWVSSMKPGDKLRCESPFRESVSEAAFIKISEDGQPFIHDIGNGTTYHLQGAVKADPALTKPEPIQLNAADSIAQKVIVHLANALEKENTEFSQELEYRADLVEAIYNATAWNPNQGKFYFLAPGVTDLVIATNTDIRAILAERFGEILNLQVLRGYADELATAQNIPKNFRGRFTEKVMALPVDRILDLVRAYRQFTSLEMVIDMFSEQGRIITIDGVAHLQYTHDLFTHGAVDKALLADYITHFGDLNKFINLIAAARFAASRKRAYVWLHAESDWGKTFFLDCLNKYGLVVNTSVPEIERIFSGQPSGKTIQEFKKAWVLAIDEFKGVKSEIKQLQNTIRFSPKGLPQVQAELFLKLFLSAEGAESLASESTGVEDQFANRFSYYVGEGNLTNRPVFQKSSADYFEAVSNYIAIELNRLTKHYQGMGKRDANNAAENVINGFYDEFRIDKKFKRLNVSLGMYAEEFSSWCIANYKTGARKKYLSERTIAEKAVGEHVFLNKGQTYYAKAPGMLLDLWLTETFNQAERGKLTFKKTQILALMGQPKATRGVSYSNPDEAVMYGLKLIQAPQEEEIT